MVSEVVAFKPRHELEAEENLAEFIRLCREDLTVFGADLDWAESYWASAKVSFGNLDQTGRKLDPSKVMQEPFLSFAKAYLRYRQGHNPTKNKQEMRALKCVERALVQSAGRADVLLINSGVLDRAAELARQTWSTGQAYHAGREIQKLAQFLNENGLVAGQIDWSSPLKRPENKFRTGKEAQREREAKLPADEAVNALAEIFASEPSDPRDVLTSSFCALALCAPSRAHELLSLTENCEVWEQDRNGNEVYRWRFQPGKGADPGMKPIPGTMVSLAEEAISRVRRLTEEARRIARWHEENPETFYPHPGVPDCGPDEPLSNWQIVKALGLSAESEQGAKQAVNNAGFSAREGAHTLRDLQEWVRSRLPEEFPWFDEERGIRYSEALFCFQRNQLHAVFPASPVLVWRPEPNRINDDLSTVHKDGGRYSQSIFDRHGYNVGREEPLKVTTHNFRHLLDTMAQRGGLDQARLAKWAGRTDIKQNRVYDHMSEGELVEMIRHNDPSLTLGDSLQEVAEEIGKRMPMTRQEFNSLSIPTAHITEYGFCIHDFTMSPCQKFRDCLNCTEQICVKGDQRLDRIKARHADVKRILEKAEKEIEEGAAEADRWYEIHALTDARLEELVGILTDPSIPDGSLVKLRNPNEFSPLRRAVEAKADSASGDPEEQGLLEDLRNMLGGGLG